MIESSRRPNLGKANPLLVKSVVGKIRPTVYDLPSEGHVFGKPIIRNPVENAETVLQNWNVIPSSKQTVPPLDYITMNCNTANQKIITPKEIRKYRKEYPVRLKEGLGENSLYKTHKPDANNIEVIGGFTRSRAPLPSDTNPMFAYGKPTRPSTPVARLMTDQYQREWASHVSESDSSKKKIQHEKEVKKKNSKLSVPHQKSAPKHKSIFEKNPSDLFKMSKFRKVPATVVCRREEPANKEKPSENFIRLNIKAAQGKLIEL
ncbi:hypothetical protein BC833DRAFT_561560 [Globomyces pollinis-pini]|nr:hypothetical protein BC833DRAFT_561560 [Globomyces pollinis-pini]